MNWARVCLWFAFVAILSLPGARVHAQPADSPEIGDLQIGFADAYKAAIRAAATSPSRVTVNLSSPTASLCEMLSAPIAAV